MVGKTVASAYAERRKRREAIREEEARAERERKRMLRWEKDDEYRHRWRRRVTVGGFLAGIILPAAAIGFGYWQFNVESESTRERFKIESELTRTQFSDEFVQNTEFFLAEKGDREDARIVRAWELLNKTEGSGGNVGQKSALQSLHRAAKTCPACASVVTFRERFLSSMTSGI